MSDFLYELLEWEGLTPSPLAVTISTVVSLVLNLAIAVLYKTTYRGRKYSQDFVHTLVIIGTVVTVIIMMISGEGGGQLAFGMFAAFSIIRFRRNLNQARDLGFIFLSMATGLAVGAMPLGRLWLVVVMIGIVCMAIYAMSKWDMFAPFRASHKLAIQVTNGTDYEVLLKPVFDVYTNEVELKAVETSKAGAITEMSYELTLRDEVAVSSFVRDLKKANDNNRVVLTVLVNDSFGA